jgi:ribosome-binding protein aMBF1 (putative translation factor)
MHPGEVTREVIRCKGCQLRQFVTASGKCRKCGCWLKEAPRPIRIEVVAPRLPRHRVGGYDVGRALAAVRHARGCSQEALAASIGVPRSYICKLERHHCNPNVESIERLARGLNISPFLFIAIAEEAGEA